MTLLVSMVWSLAISCLADENKAVPTIQIKNDDLRWRGSPLGLLPELVGDSGDVAKNITKDHTELLATALRDPKRFAAAHVLLIRMYGIEENDFDLDAPNEEDFINWNGLRFANPKDGPATYDAIARTKLTKYWNTRLRAGVKPEQSAAR